MSLFTEIYENIIIDGTYKTIFNGLCATVRISLFSIIFATLIGFLILLLLISKNKFLNTFANIYIAFIRGTPVLMLLMMMYYVVFSKSVIEAEYVAIITFSLNTAAYIAKLLHSSILALDTGEIDAARTLGFSKTKAFVYITIPQCIKLSKPVFESTIINMIQWTSVVGYVTITDLTRIINQIATRTMKPTLLILIGMFLYILIAYFVKFLFYISDIIDKKRNLTIETIDEKEKDTNFFERNDDNITYPLEFRNVYKSFGNLEVYNNLNFKIKNGEIVSIIGPSGCGKSVFLKMSIGLLPYDKGEVIINGVNINNIKNIDQIRRKIGFVYQNFNLFSHLDIMENLMLAPMLILKEDKKKAYIKSKILLSSFGLLNHAHKYPNELSGGQKQRVAIARCLMMNPNLLIMDEPTSALDPSMIGEVQAIIRMLKKFSITMLVVTHEMDFAKDISNRVCFIEEKNIYEEGTPSEIFDNPKKEKTISFVKKLKNLIYIVNKAEYDLYDFKGKIISFANRYGIEKNNLRRIEIIIEEVLIELFNKNLYNIIEFNIEFNEKDRIIEINISYKGDKYDIFEEDELSEEHIGILIIRKSCLKFEHIYKNNTNLIKIVL